MYIHPFAGSSMFREIRLSAVAWYGNTDIYFYHIPAVRDRALAGTMALHRVMSLLYAVKKVGSLHRNVG